MTKQVIIGTFITVALGGVAAATGWSQSHLSAETISLKSPTGIVAGVATTSPTPPVESQPAGSSINSVATLVVTPTPFAAKRVNAPALTSASVAQTTPTPAPIAASTPTPAPVPVTTPFPIQTPAPPACGKCGPIMRINTTSSDFACPMYCLN